MKRNVPKDDLDIEQQRNAKDSFWMVVYGGGDLISYKSVNIRQFSRLWLNNQQRQLDSPPTKLALARLQKKSRFYQSLTNHKNLSIPESLQTL